MFNWIRFLFRDRRFPARVADHWYCGCWYLHICELRENGKYNGSSLNPPDIESPARNKVAFNPFRTGHAGRDTSGLVDGLIPAIRIDGRIGLYRQIGNPYRTTAFYDGAPWDDGRHINMRFVRTIRATEKTPV